MDSKSAILDETNREGFGDFQPSNRCLPHSPDANLLPQPVFGKIDNDEQLQLEKLQFGLNRSSNVRKGVETKSPPKTIHEDGPSLPLPSEEETDWFGVQLRKEKEWKAKNKVCVPSLPVDHYTEGKIVYGTKTALKQMVADLARLKCGTTGCIVDETCDPLCDAYDAEVHFLVEQNLGKGSFGNVHRCYDSKTQRPFIRKQIFKKELLRSSEILVPLILNHRNISRFYGMIQRRNTEDMGNPTVELLIEDSGCALNRWMVYEGKTFTKAQIWSLTTQGLSALAHIDHFGIVHQDIKPENICVLAMKDGSLQLKVTDFGSSRLPVEPTKFVGVTPEYMAPEMCKIYLQTLPQMRVNWNLTEADITGKVDMFAFGLVIMYMYKGYHILVKVINNGNTTYAGVDEESRGIMQLQLMAMLANDSFVHCLIPDECDLDIRDLLQKMTEHNHTNRYTAKQALDFIEGIAEDCMESENGLIKNRTKDLRFKPYDKQASNKAMYMKQKSQTGGATQLPVEQKRRFEGGIASKKLVTAPTDTVQATRTRVNAPQISDFKSLNIGQTAMEEEHDMVPYTEFRLEHPQPPVSFTSNSNEVSQLSSPQQPSGADSIIIVPSGALLEILHKRKLVRQSQMTNTVPVPQTQSVKVEPFPDPIDILRGPQVQMTRPGHQVFRQPTQLATPSYQEQDLRSGLVGIMRLDENAEERFNSIDSYESPVQMDTERGNIPNFAAFM